MYKYQEIAVELKKVFTSGKYKPGALLPDQETLAKEFATTRMTIRKAIQTLVVEGVVYTKRGAGTFLRKDYDAQDHDMESLIDKPIGATETYSGRKVTSRVLSLNARLPDEEEQRRLIIGPSEPVYLIRRVRYVDNQVYAYERTVMPTKIATITEEVLRGSVYKHLAEESHIHIAGSHRRVYAIKATQDDVDALGAKLNDPVLAIKQVSYTEEGEPFEYSITHFPYETSSVIADVELATGTSGLSQLRHKSRTH
ncbi:GntR family transcriptional regulator [Lacticaseibacillus zhaodongensis]|uniref:GntR family transcriptional regulator n=1 Tax=Lacticaseibacillus zhaodongensis TaxID=2668065 RepID=UPI001E2B4D54|nr:GntR family transcriptional regulator [Lacticaseibacillus zhaodongensis]